MSELLQVIRTINERHGTRWQVVKRLPGGYSARGAHLLCDRDVLAVLKLHPPGRTHTRLAATAEAIAGAIEAGWATPRWLAFGLLPAGEWYVLEEFIEGSRPEALGETELALLLETSRRQARLRPAIDADWSAYVIREVFEPTPAAKRISEREDTSGLLGRLRSLTHRSRDIELPRTDLVHGDFTLENALIHGGRAYIVDAEFAGKGTRAYDLATLLVHAGTGDIGAPRPTIRRLREECVSVVGQDGLIICAAARIIGLVHFGFDHWPDDVASFVERCHAFLDHLSSD